MTDSDLTDRERSFLAHVRDFARERVVPFAAEWEQRGEFPIETFREGARLGLTGLLIPEDIGGLGLSHVASARALEEVASACFAFAFSLFVHHNVIAGIAKYGTPAQIRQLLPSMLRGDRIGAFCLTESEAGSDAAAISMTATQRDGVWELHGEKSWITNGTVADVYSIYAQTDATRGWRGIACFLVDGDSPGLHRHPAYSLLGAHAMGTNGITLQHCRVPDHGMLLGPGDGFKGAMAGINRARMAIAVMCCSIAKASLETAVVYAGSRRAFGRRIASFQALQFALADVATELEAARLLAYNAARLLDSGEKAIVEAAHAKKFSTTIALRSISVCMRVLGANGLRTDYPLGRHFANAQMCQYLDGTDEIQNIVIGRSLFRDRGIEIE